MDNQVYNQFINISNEICQETMEQEFNPVPGDLVYVIRYNEVVLIEWVSPEGKGYGASSSTGDWSLRRDDFRKPTDEEAKTYKQSFLYEKPVSDDIPDFLKKLMINSSYVKKDKEDES